MSTGTRQGTLRSDASDAFTAYWNKAPSVAVIEAAFQNRWDAEGVGRKFHTPRRVPHLGWRCAPHMRTTIVLDALEMARWSRGTPLPGGSGH